MTIAYESDRALFSDVVAVSEADALLEWLQQHPAGQVDLSACTHLHPANLQVLMAGRAKVSAWPTDRTLATWLEPALGAR